MKNKEECNDVAGFGWVFKTQIYPPGYEQFTKEVYDRLKLPVTVRTDLPETPVKHFSRWVDKMISET